jgi:hypothetical protein
MAEVMKFWRALEELLGPSGVACRWEGRVGDEFAAVKAAFLQARPRPAVSYPCPHGCGCAHAVVRHEDGRMVAVCRCDPWNCDDLRLSEADLVVYELSWAKLGRALAGAFGWAVKGGALPLPGTVQIGAYGSAAVPVILTIQTEPSDFRGVVAELAARLRGPFILFAPTSRFVDGTCQELLANCRAGFFDLESHVSLTAQGNLQARKPGVELFARFLPEEKEPLPEDVARKAFKLIEQLDSDQVIKPPSVLAVFRLYCVKELTADQVARKCRCSKGTIINRLKLIREKTGTEPDELRRFSSHFDQIEDDIRESRASHIHRKRLIGDNKGPEDGEY